MKALGSCPSAYWQKYFTNLKSTESPNSSMPRGYASLISLPVSASAACACQEVKWASLYTLQPPASCSPQDVYIQQASSLSFGMQAEALLDGVWDSSREFTAVAGHGLDVQQARLDSPLGSVSAGASAGTCRRRAARRGIRCLCYCRQAGAAAPGALSAASHLAASHSDTLLRSPPRLPALSACTVSVRESTSQVYGVEGFIETVQCDDSQAYLPCIRTHCACARTYSLQDVSMQTIALRSLSLHMHATTLRL